MCRTTLISNNIVRLGTRSFRQRMEAVSGRKYPIGQLSDLNRDIESLCDLLHEDYNSITSEDYSVFGPQLKMMLQSMKDLHRLCSAMPSSYNFERETERLEMNRSDLYELSYDIENYLLPEKINPSLSSLLREASSALKSLARK